jgi:hypothetical protein
VPKEPWVGEQALDPSWLLATKSADSEPLTFFWRRIGDSNSPTPTSLRGNQGLIGATRIVLAPLSADEMHKRILPGTSNSAHSYVQSCCTRLPCFMVSKAPKIEFTTARTLDKSETALLDQRAKNTTSYLVTRCLSACRLLEYQRPNS